MNNISKLGEDIEKRLQGIEKTQDEYNKMVKREYTHDKSLQRTLIIKISLLVAFVLYFAYYNKITIEKISLTEIFYLLIFFTLFILILVIVGKVFNENLNIIFYLSVYLSFLLTIFMYFNLIIVNLIYFNAADTRSSQIKMYDKIYYYLLIIILIYIIILISLSKNYNAFQNFNIANIIVKNKINGDDKENTMKLNVFLDTILNFIYLYIVLRIFLYLLNRSNK